ncbi:DUF423 domain-containing protein [Desmospora profundinema]|uniref:Uncharacterized membrane protein YgdD (TMEM256/DUF423 family) n=1 Tax=Desmospora profundinema TaxID=1571184 RepID=A0ABU1ISA2_9BACL|nr:DUF423 domain-containing protein [Desmospora profundinema]MDR6227586.1 uncharacterized membrane protein YgdD (TMEM256/DUF423 family) [Desmospora profundinema]
MKLFIILGAVNLFLSISFGAFGAHGLEGRISERMLNNWQTAAQYHMAHALGLLFIGLLAGKVGESALVSAGGWLILAGIVLFAGSLYVMALTNITVLGAITPIGGLAFLAGWICIAWAAWTQL